MISCLWIAALSKFIWAAGEINLTVHNSKCADSLVLCQLQDFLEINFGAWCFLIEYDIAKASAHIEGSLFASCSCEMLNSTASCNLTNHSVFIQHKQWGNCSCCHSEHQIEITCNEWVLPKGILVCFCSLASCEWCLFLNLKSPAAWNISSGSLKKKKVSCFGTQEIG